MTTLRRDEPDVTAPSHPLRRVLHARWVRSKALWVVVLAGLAVLAFLLVDGSRRAVEARRELLHARTDLVAASNTLRPVIRMQAAGWPTAEEYRDAQQRIALASNRLDRSRARLGWVEGALSASGWLPVWGDELSGLPDVLQTGEQLLASAARLLEEVTPLFDGDGRMIDAARTVFVDRHAQIDAELATLEAGAARIEELRARSWSGPLTAVDNTLDRLGGDLERVAEGRAIVTAVHGGFDALFGIGEPASYLVLGQNDHEIRPTGGFIGTMGLLSVVEGRVERSDYRSSYEFSPREAPPLEPPADFAHFFGASQWHVRDANWWADFPTSAEEVLRVAEAESGVTADHVLAIDTAMVGLLLRVFGPISVPEFGEPLTDRNWFANVEAQLSDSIDDLEGRAATLAQRESRQTYLQPVMQALLERAQEAGREEVPALMRALAEGATGRHVQLYSRDPAVQTAAEQLSVAGSLDAVPGQDLVAVVDSNLSYSKIQPAVEREVVYLERADGAVDLLITWRNQLPTFDGVRYERLGSSGRVWDPAAREFRMAHGTFGNYVRVYLPPGTKLLGTTGFDGLPRYQQLHDLAEVGGFVEVPPGERRSVRLTYRLREGDPAAVRFWKQGGQSSTHLRVLAHTPHGQQERFVGTLDGDQTIALDPDAEQK